MNPPPSPEVTVFWRPGCGFCSALLSRLSSSDLRYTTINIWENPDAAAYVRSVARGSETVPTVRIGDRALVNPSFRELVAAAAGEPPSIRWGRLR